MEGKSHFVDRPETCLISIESSKDIMPTKMNRKNFIENEIELKIYNMWRPTLDFEFTMSDQQSLQSSPLNTPELLESKINNQVRVCKTRQKCSRNPATLK